VKRRGENVASTRAHRGSIATRAANSSSASNARIARMRENVRPVVTHRHPPPHPHHPTVVCATSRARRWVGVVARRCETRRRRRARSRDDGVGKSHTARARHRDIATSRRASVPSSVAHPIHPIRPFSLASRRPRLHRVDPPSFARRLIFHSRPHRAACTRPRRAVCESDRRANTWRLCTLHYEFDSHMETIKKTRGVWTPRDVRGVF